MKNYQHHHYHNHHHVPKECTKSLAVRAKSGTRLHGALRTLVPTSNFEIYNLALDSSRKTYSQ